MNHKILVVDDMPDVRKEVQVLLSKKYDVLAACSAEEALELCETDGPFAVVITDQGMPGKSGTELLGELRQRWPESVRIMMTGYADLELAIQALHQGAIFRFMQKPLRPRDLLDAVAAAVERFGRHQEEQLLTEQLQFSRESLLSLTEALDHRLATQIARMRGLQRYSTELADARSLYEVADYTARAVHKLLGSRAVEVLLDVDLAETTVRATRGTLPEEVHQEPIRSSDGELGVLRVADRDEAGRQLGEGDREVLASVVCIAAIATNNQLALRARDLAHDATIFALERLAENRDDETGKHLERVSRYCGMIAKKLREHERYSDTVTDEYVKDLVVSAPLHDIGKVGIPDSILLKPGKLDDREWEIMRRHPTIGAQTLRHVMEQTGEQSYLLMGHDIAWCHHEKWDGSGYPRGLVGEEIPLSARIVSLADCYDALTTWRPYKGPWTHEDAAQYLKEKGGSQFDPDVVDAFVALQDEFDEIRQRLADTKEDVEAKRVA